MLQHWPPERKQPHVLDFDLTSIAFFPRSACDFDREGTRRLFPGWEAIIQAFATKSEGLGFKPFFVKRSGLGQQTDTTALLEEILENCRLEPRAIS